MTMTIHTAFKASLFLAALAASQGFAAGPRPDPMSLDTDGDGFVSLTEFEAGAPQPPTPAEIFAKLDADGDGLLSDSELARRGHAGRGRRGPGFADDDQDGLISRDEFVGNAPRHAHDPDALFDRLDANEDGYLDPDELAHGRPPRH